MAAAAYVRPQDLCTIYLMYMYQPCVPHGVSQLLYQMLYHSPYNRNTLTLFVGLGLILLAMVLVGWKCTPADHEPCHMLFGLGAYSTISRRGRRRRERLYWLGGRHAF